MQRFILFLSIIAFVSCKDKNVQDAIVGQTSVKIMFLEPTAGQIVPSNEQIHMEARIEADALMGGWRANLIDREKNEVLDSFEDLYNQTQYFAHHHWILEVDSTKNLKIEVFALSTEKKVLGSKTIELSCQP